MQRIFMWYQWLRFFIFSSVYTHSARTCTQIQKYLARLQPAINDNRYHFNIYSLSFGAMVYHSCACWWTIIFHLLWLFCHCKGTKRRRKKQTWRPNTNTIKFTDISFDDLVLVPPARLSTDTRNLSHITYVPLTVLFLLMFLISFIMNLSPKM